MKKIIAIVCAVAVMLSLGVVAYAANNNRTTQPETAQGEKFPAESPQMNGEKPSGHPDVIDFDAMVKNGIISQETCDKIKAYMEEHRPSNLPDMNGQSPQMGGQAPDMNGQPPQTDGQAPDMNGQPPQMDGQVPDMNSQLPQMGGQAPNMNGQPPQMNGQAPNGEAPSDLPLPCTSTELW